MRELVVLSEGDLLYCYGEGVRVKVYTRLPARGERLAELKYCQQKGEYDPSEKRISVYLPHIEDIVDYKVTLFHEFAHALDDLLFDDKYPEEKIEQITQKTYKTNRMLFEFIRELYGLPTTRFERRLKDR